MREKDLFFSFSHKEIRATNRVCAGGLFFQSRASESGRKLLAKILIKMKKLKRRKHAQEKGRKKKRQPLFDTFKLTTSHRIYYRTRRRFSSRTQKTPAAIAIIVSILTIGLNAIAAARLHCFFQLSRQRIRALTGRASISHLVLFPY